MRQLIGVISISRKQGPQGPVGPPSGVNTWNTRDGEVLPEYGDYNLSMVGAELLTNTDIDELWRDN